MLGANSWRAYGPVLLLTLPWLVPPQHAPSPSVVPWLVSLGCAALLLLSSPAARRSRYPEPTAGLGKSLAWAWLLAAVLNTLIAFSQYIDIEQAFFWMTGADPGQVYGNLRQRNQYATLTTMGLAATLWWAASGTAAGRWRSGPALVAAFLAAGNAASGSRTGLAEFLFVSLLFLWWAQERPSQVRRLLSISWLAYVLTALLLAWRAEHAAAAGGIIARAYESQPPCASRLVMWQNVLELIRQRPWTGWGWGELDYAHFVSDYQGMRECELIDNAHNLPLHIAAELGLPVALLAMGLMVYRAWNAKPWRERDGTRQVMWAGLGVILLHSMVEYPLWYGPFMLAVLVCLGLLLSRAPAGNADQGRKHFAAWQRTAGAVMLLCVAYAGWDYFRISQIYLPPHQRLERYREHTLDKIRSSWLFRDQVRFAEFTITAVTRENAAGLYAMGLELLHYSPEPRVVEKLIESATLLERNEEARFYLERLRTAYPNEYARWVASMGACAPPPN